MSEPQPHVCYFQMTEGGMACACGETIEAEPVHMATMLRVVELAMRLEGIGPIAREHVLNRLLYGDPRGAGPKAIPITGFTITERPLTGVQRQAIARLDQLRAASVRAHFGLPV